MTNKTYIACMCLVFMGIGGCTSGESGINFGDFQNAVAAQAGNGATDCTSTDDPNLCIADSFQNVTPAFVAFLGQGLDSQGGSGTAITVASRVFFMSFDSDPTGGGSLNNGRITTRECLNPQPSATGVGAFTCEDVRANSG